MTTETEVFRDSDSKRLGAALVEPPTQDPPARLNRCPEEWFIDGQEPSNWRKHRAALSVEARAWVAEDKAKLDWLLYEAPFETVLRSPLVGKIVVKEWKHSMRPRRRAYG